MSWGFSSSTNNNNNNNNSNSGGFGGWGNNNSTNTSNNSSSSNNNGGFGGWNTNNSSNNNNNSNSTNQPQLVTRKSLFSNLNKTQQEEFLKFEIQVVRATEQRKQELDATIKKLEKLPDIGDVLRMHSDQTRLLTERLDSYKHDLEPFTNKLKAEFVCASRAQVDVQRQSMQSVQVQDLPPKFYWDKIEEFQVQMNELRKQLQSLHQHLNDTMNNPHSTEVINTKSVANALNASRRSTLNIAAQVISNHQQIQKLKTEYKKYRLQQFGDSHDPFEDAKEREKQRQQKIQQYLSDQSDGLQMSGLQIMGNTNNSNNNNNNNGNGSNNNNNNNNNGNNNGGNNSGSGWGGFGTSNNNNNNSNTGNTNNGSGGSSNPWSFGSSNTNTNNNNNSNNSNTNSSGGFSW